MSAADLDAMLAAHDEAALVALASKGLARRAERDVAAGKASISARSEAEATLTVDGETVVLDAKGPTAARCTCPAHGVCRHILSAVLLLRAETSAAPPAQSPREELLALADAALEKFAGADWADAAALARQGGTVTEDGASLSVALSGQDHAVTFIAGAGLKGAVWKGPKTRARKSTAAAALIVRAAAGKAPPPSAAPAVALDPAFLDALGPEIERAMTAALNGAADLARDALFDLAVSARAEAAPRLASMLRGLSEQAALARANDVAFRPDGFLRAAAHAYALTKALKSAPADVALSGALRRDYRAEGPLTLHILGAAAWRTLAGARGLRVYGYDPANARWLSAGPARAAGADPTFDPRTAYRGPLWEACSIEDAMGRALALPAPRVSDDRRVAGTTEARAEIVETEARWDQRDLDAATHADWSVARADLAGRFGEGLRRAATPEPLLIRPHAFGPVGFDEVAQEFVLPALDPLGRALELSLPPDDQSAPHRIRAMLPNLKALLIEAVLDADRLRFSPVSLIGDGTGRLDVWNLGLDPLRRRGLIGEATDTLGAMLKGRRPDKPPPAVPRSDALAGGVDPLRRLAARALDIAAESARGQTPPGAARAAREAEDLGLTALSRALTDLTASAPPPSAAPAGAAPVLRLAYLAGEIQTLSQFR